MIRIIVIVTLGISNASSSNGAQIAKIYPVDEAATDPDFFAFRARLLVALQQRNTSLLYDIVARDILNSFGGDGGLAEFKARWRPEDAASKVWVILTEILALGGQFQPPPPDYGSKMFVAPYTFSVKPSVDFDPFEYGVVIGRDVEVRHQPNRTSAVLAKLEFDIIRITNWAARTDTNESQAPSWVAVQLADGRSGYVTSQVVRSRIGYRAIFVLRDGRWLLKALVAGD